MRHLDEEPPLTIYSAHDSTLIGLLCAFRLEQPTEWPEYGSYLKIDLLEKTNVDKDDDLEEKEYVVRFYLNGKLLRSQWHGELREEISLNKLSHYVSTEGAVKSP
jgi:acid phosphatase